MIFTCAHIQISVSHRLIDGALISFSILSKSEVKTIKDWLHIGAQWLSAI